MPFRTGNTTPFLWPLLMFFYPYPALYSQSAPVPGNHQSPASMAESIHHAHGKEIHIFYIHGIASDGPDDFDSLTLRKTICNYLKDCTTPAGTQIGPWDYADQGEFQSDAPVPPLKYMDDPVWMNAEEWRAAAPYAIHFQLARSGDSTLYVDSLNWWPLTFALKCRQIVASDAELVAPSKQRIELCSRRQPNPDVPSRFKSYDWISKDEAARLLKLPSKGAHANRTMKNGLMDWGFSDAVMALGPLRPYIQNALRQLILKSLADSPESRAADPTGPPVNLEFMSSPTALEVISSFPRSIWIHRSMLQLSRHPAVNSNRYWRAPRWSTSLRISCACSNWPASTARAIRTLSPILNHGGRSGATISNPFPTLLNSASLPESSP